MGGTLTVQSGARLPVSVRQVSSGVGLERVGGERVGWCTLLGPEGPGFLLTRECGEGLGLRVLRWAGVNLPVWWGSVGADRMLRTTQWTRAS